MKTEAVIVQWFNFNFQIHRCHKCGTFWGTEDLRNFSVINGIAICPNCAIEAVEDERKTVRRLNATIIGLKGALTRAQRKGGAS